MAKKARRGTNSIIGFSLIVRTFPVMWRLFKICYMMIIGCKNPVIHTITYFPMNIFSFDRLMFEKSKNNT